MSVRKEKELPIDLTADRLMPLWEVELRLRSGPRVVNQLVSLGILKTIGVKSNKRVRVFHFNEFLRNLEGKDLYQVIEEVKKQQDIHLVDAG